MEIITNEARINEYVTLAEYYPPEDVVIFDIETTGFSAEHTMLYMIGCCHYTAGKWWITQWFNNDGTSEQEVLLCFLDFIRNYKLLLSYNGDGFDLPYLSKKITAYELESPFDRLESVDLYRLIRPLKKHLPLEDLKQKNLERFLDLNRLDKYSGGDLIKVYKKYTERADAKDRQLLIQHNYEDLEGLLYCFSLLAYMRLKAGCFTVKQMSLKDGRLLFHLALDYALPKRITLTVEEIMISAYREEATIQVPVFHGELKFFFEDYREYYYLPMEDMAVHKSVSSFVNSDYRERATRDNCYVKKTGYFINQLDAELADGYKKTSKDKSSYILLVDSFLQNPDLLNAYARYVVQKAF